MAARKYSTEAERKAAKAIQAKAAKERWKAKQASLNQSQSQSFSPLSQSASPNLNSESPTVLHAVDAGDSAAPRALGRNEKKYQKLLDDYLGPATACIILVLCLFIYGFDMESSEKIADHLAMNQAEQDLIIPAAASLMDKQHWDEETRDRILQSGDVIGLLLGVSMYGSRVIGTLNELKGHVSGISRNASQQAAPSGQPGTNGHDPGIAWGSELAGFSQYAA